MKKSIEVVLVTLSRKSAKVYNAFLQESISCKNIFLQQMRELDAPTTGDVNFLTECWAEAEHSIQLARDRELEILWYTCIPEDLYIKW